MFWSFRTIEFNTFIREQTCAQTGARRRERCCICHYLSWTDSIKPSLCFQTLDAVFPKDLLSDYLPDVRYWSKTLRCTIPKPPPRHWPWTGFTSAQLRPGLCCGSYTSCSVRVKDFCSSMKSIFERNGVCIQILGCNLHLRDILFV